MEAIASHWNCSEEEKREACWHGRVGEYEEQAYDFDRWVMFCHASLLYALSFAVFRARHVDGHHTRHGKLGSTLLYESCMDVDTNVLRLSSKLKYLLASLTQPSRSPS